MNPICPRCKKDHVKTITWEINSYIQYVEGDDLYNHEYDETLAMGVFKKAWTTCMECGLEDHAEAFQIFTDNPVIKE